MNLFPYSCELYSHPFLWEKISIPGNILYLRIKFSKLVTNIDKYIYIVLVLGIYEYDLKQTHFYSLIKILSSNSTLEIQRR